ncbi:MAG: tetratricopeptide repeat protein [Armatimonadota bacterium]
MTARLGIVLLLMLGLFTLPPAIPAAEPEILPGAEEIITKADALGANRDYAGAIAILQRALERYPTYPRLYKALAVWQEWTAIVKIAAFVPEEDPDIRVAKSKARLRWDLSKPEYTDIVRSLMDTYGLGATNLQHPEEMLQHAQSLVSYEYPLSLGEYGPLVLPGNPTPFVYTLSDPRLPAEKRGEYQGMITLRPLQVPRRNEPPAGIARDDRYALDPKYGQDNKYAQDARYANWRFHYMLLAYTYDRNTRRWDLRFRVMWQNVRSEREYIQRAQLAQQTAQLLLRLSWLAEAYAGVKEPLFSRDGTINVWLAEKGMAGGEAFNDNIYLQEVGTPRKAAEWVREVAHEYGHETLRAVGKYTQPEWGANGRLGERIYARWLLANPEPAGSAHPWVAQIDAKNFHETRILRLIRQFAGIGPEMPQMRDTNAMAMDSFLGLALYLDITRGSKLLADVLEKMTEPDFDGRSAQNKDAGGFLPTLEGMETYTQSGDHPTVSLSLAELPTDLPLWVYLVKGNWQGQLEARAALPEKLKVDVNGKSQTVDTTGAFTTGDLTTGWHRLRLTPPEGATINWLYLRLTKQ